MIIKFIIFLCFDSLPNKMSTILASIKVLVWSLIQSKKEFHSSLTYVHSQNKWDKVSEYRSQKEHKSDCKIPILFKNTFVVKILWTILYWNHWICTSVDILKSARLCNFHQNLSTSRLSSFSHFVSYFGFSQDVAVIISYISLDPFLFFLELDELSISTHKNIPKC